MLSGFSKVDKESAYRVQKIKVLSSALDISEVNIDNNH